jgi:hypothetical protein
VFVLLLCVRVLQVSPQVQGLRALHGGAAAGASGTGPRCTPVLNPAEHLRFSLCVFSYSVRPLGICVHSCSSRGTLYLGADLAVVLQAPCVSTPCVLVGAALAYVLVQSRALSHLFRSHTVCVQRPGRAASPPASFIHRSPAVSVCFLSVRSSVFTE